MSSEVINRSGLKHNVYFRLSLILFAGLLLRIYLSTLISFEGDFNTWQGWGNGLVKDGFSHFYARNWCDYMPGYLYVLRLLSEIRDAIPWLSPQILFKLPANLADLGISILIFIVLRPISSVKVAMISSVAYFFNPAVLSNSTLWGQIDSFHAFPILLAIILCLRKYYIWSGLFAALAFMIKPQSIVLFPVIGFIAISPFFISHNRWRFLNFVPGLKILITAIITCTIITMPFIWDRFDSFFYIFTGPLDLITERFNAAYGQYEYTSLNAFNFWGSFSMWWSDKDIFLGLTLKTWGTIIFAVFYSTIFISLFRFKLFIKKSYIEYQYLIFQAVTLILFSLYLFVTRAHERHLLPAIVFFTLIIFRSWIFPYLYAIVSGVYVCNMIFSYIQLTTSYKGIPDNIEMILSASMSIMYMIAFFIVFIHFLKHAFRQKI
jgi:Gpi18-like mannosyltransferase